MNFYAAGFGKVKLFILMLAVLAVGTGVMVVQKSTEFSNQASSLGVTYFGTVEKVSPCVQNNLCFQLANANDGKNHYLLVRKGWFSNTGLDLNQFLGKAVKLEGNEISNAAGKNFIAVRQVSLNPNAKALCKVMLYRADANMSLPSQNPVEIDPQTTKIKPGEYYMYSVRIPAQDLVKEHDYVVTSSQLHGANEPIRYLKADPNCRLDLTNKTSNCKADNILPQPNSSYYVLPAEHVFQVLTPYPGDPKTSTLFTVKSDLGEMQCASMLFYENQIGTTVTPVPILTPVPSEILGNCVNNEDCQKFYCQKDKLRCAMMSASVKCVKNRCVFSDDDF